MNDQDILKAANDALRRAKAAEKRVLELEELVADMERRKDDPVWDRLTTLAKKIEAAGSPGYDQALERIAVLEALLREASEEGCFVIGGSTTHSICETSGYPPEDWCVNCRIHLALSNSSEKIEHANAFSQDETANENLKKQIAEIIQELKDCIAGAEESSNNKKLEFQDREYWSGVASGLSQALNSITKIRD